MGDISINISMVKFIKFSVTSILVKHDHFFI